MEKDMEGMEDNLRILAYTPGDGELNDLLDNHMKQTHNQLEIMRSRDGYTMHHQQSFIPQERRFSKERNFDLYKQVRLMMNKKGYLKQTGLVGPKQFEEVEAEKETEEQQQ